MDISLDQGGSIEVSREQLYDQVWGTPINHLAEKFGVSGSYLARVCTALNVPRPPLGYWQKKAVGKDKPRPDLPSPRPGDQLTWKKDGALATPVVKDVRPRADDRSRAKETAPVKASIRRHPMLRGVEDHFRKSRKTDEGEFLRPYKLLLPDIVTSEGSMGRAIGLAGRIYNALEDKGHRVLFAPPDQAMRRAKVDEREFPKNDRKYGRYSVGTIWVPHRPTITYIGSVPVGLALTEMTERTTLRYLHGQYIREDSRLVKSARASELAHSWTSEQDLPCGRFRLVAYSPHPRVDWVSSWQETRETTLEEMIPSLVQELESAETKLQALSIAADEAAAQRQRERDEEWARQLREEDRRRVAQASSDSKKQLADIMEKWAAVKSVERFFIDAETSLSELEGERRQHLEKRLALARSMLGTLDPLAYLEDWLAPEERYQSKSTEN